MGERRTVLTWIAIFRLIKGVLFLVVGIGAITLINRNVSEVTQEWLDKLYFDSDSNHLDTLMGRVGFLSIHQLVLIGAGAFLYSGLFLTEGIGLLLRKRWAEYFTAFITASFIPFEVYELIFHLTWLKMALLIVNAAIFVYIVVRIRNRNRLEKLTLIA
jgi:uncharacterized membrane protein (DUF2068 family)